MKKTKGVLMKIGIDISGQIQQRSYDSSLGFKRSDGLKGSIFLRKQLKKTIIQKYKGQITNLIEKLHCILIYYAIKDNLKGVKEIKICKDISLRRIKNLLPKLFKENKLFPNIKITFRNKTNGKSNGHNPALKSFRHRKYADKILIKKDVENVLFKFK